MLSCLLEEGQISMNLSINFFFARIMSNDSNLGRPNHREKNICVFVSGNIHFHAESFFSCWQSLMHVHLSLQVSRTCQQTNQPNMFTSV